RPALIGYDGSSAARAAVAEAARVLKGPAVVATAWTSFREAAPEVLLAIPADAVGDAVDDLDAVERETAEALAAEGVALAREAGLEAEARALRSTGPHFAALIALADELDAEVIVVGSRGRSALAAAVLGSVSTGVLHHTRRPVLVVRGPDH
ncbi:MAG TPA: universal stress protein, partial [Solirubrobacteraceae bacterium]